MISGGRADPCRKIALAGLAPSRQQAQARDVRPPLSRKSASPQL